MTKVLVVSNDIVGSAMAGPAIRCWEMARLLAGHGHEVRLSAPQESDRPGDGFELRVSSARELAAEADWAEVIVIQGLVLATYPALKFSSAKLVVDLYDPFNLEILELFHDDLLDVRWEQHRGHLGALVDQVARGDFFLCASEKQRDYWLGVLSGLGRVNPDTHGADRLLRSLIDVAPFGISSTAPEHSRAPAARGVLPGIEQDARLVVWGGGVYNWFDPLSLLRAWPRVLAGIPTARLLFMGLQHPNPDVPAMAMTGKALALAEELGLKDSSVHFNLGWVPYQRRQDFLLESELGVSFHFEHVETAFSFRTRMLDYIWAGLPMVATRGDEFARWIEETGSGRVVDYESPEEIADAIVELLGDDGARHACAAAVAAHRNDFTWERALAPLVAFCDKPHSAPDLVSGRAHPKHAERSASEALASITAPRSPLGRVAFYMRREGTGAMVKRVGRSVIRRMRRGVAST